MSLISYKRGQGSIILRVKILDSSVSTGAGKTGLTSSSSGLIISTIADNEATPTIYAQGSSNVETITTLGTFAAPTSGKCRFKEVDSTNHKGVYEIQIADARYAVSSAKSMLVSISGVTNAAETDCVIPLTDMDPYDAVRGGMTALPNANAAASGGLLTFGSSTGQINPSSGKVPATLASTDVTGNVASDVQTIKTQTVTCAAGVTVNVNVGTTQPLNFTGTAGSALVKSDMVDVAGAAVSTSTAQIGVNVVNFGGSAGTFASGRPEVNASHIAGSAVSTSSAQIGVNVVNAGGTAWGSGAITAASIATDAITAAKIAADAIGASELAADAVTEIQSGLATSSALSSLSGIFTGITSLAQWLGLIAGKQTGNSTARTEIRATGAGSGTFDETTDSQEALRDRGDAAWTTGTSLDAAGVRAAVGLASANLDTQLDALPTNSELATSVLTTQMTESYAADGTAPTLAQAIFLIQQSLHEFAISGTIRTVKKLDGLTTAATFTLDSSTAPTSTTRAT